MQMPEAWKATLDKVPTASDVVIRNGQSKAKPIRQNRPITVNIEYFTNNNKSVYLEISTR